MAETSADALDLEQFKGHTPGPWTSELEDDGEVSGVTFIIRMGSALQSRRSWEPQHRIEYEVSAEDESPEQFAEAEANTALIAAAPVLLAEVRRLRAHQETLRNELQRLCQRWGQYIAEDDTDDFGMERKSVREDDLEELRAALSAGSPEPERTT